MIIRPLPTGTRLRALVSLFTGSGALELAILAGYGAAPPVAYMGSKRKFARQILGVLGLREGCSADALLLCDAGPWGWAWQALLCPETCREVAATLRGWRGEDPRALWSRLAAEPPPAELVERTTTFLALQARTAGNLATWHNGESWRMADHATGRTIRAGQSGTNDGPAPGETARRVESLLPVRWPAESRTYAGRAEDIDPAQVARWLWVQGRALGSAPVFPGPDGTWHASDGASRGGGSGPVPQKTPAASGLTSPCTVASRAEGLARVTWPPTLVYHGRAEDLEPAGDLIGTLFYGDPPYQGRTGYAADCPRESVLAMAEQAHAAGATVVLSEAEPLEVLRGWRTACLNPDAPARSQEWVTANCELDLSVLPRRQLALGLGRPAA